MAADSPPIINFHNQEKKVSLPFWVMVLLAITVNLQHLARHIQIALVGNPNSGKSSLFNALTGMNQRVGNYPGVTVDKKTGITKLSPTLQAQVIDLPGTYSLYPKSEDERVTCNVLLNSQDPNHPDIILIIVDASNLKRNLLFSTQIMDLKIPVIVCLTMLDIARKKGITIDVDELERQLGVPVVAINPRKNKGIAELKQNLLFTYDQDFVPRPTSFWQPSPALAPPEMLEQIRTLTEASSGYAALHHAANYQDTQFLSTIQKAAIAQLVHDYDFSKSKVQAQEITERYKKIGSIMQVAVAEDNFLKKELWSERADKILLDPFWGHVILLGILFLLFQSIFWMATYPMDWVEAGFNALRIWVSHQLPAGAFSDLIVNGVLAGLGGIAVFVPQIMILFGFITILEDSGYMARISFLTDRLMRSVGLNGRSVMPLIGGMACAVPAIMSARTIQNKKERLITIMVTPLMSCSARLPVYTILIELVIPDKTLWGFFSLHGLVFMGLYLLGFVMALVVAKVLDRFVKQTGKSYFLMELPVYKMPRWKNVVTTMVEKAKIFVTDAGKVIMIISLVLWVMASYGPPHSMHAVRAQYSTLKAAHPEQAAALALDEQQALLNHSFAGVLGKHIEPIIRPLGYDWKIGIALITSFAAREVFVGTMATLYSVGNDDAELDLKLKEKMRRAVRADGTPVYTLATGLSLLVFYVFAMQCMSTLAVVKRETKSWKWPMIQLGYLSVIAYVSAWVVYHIFR